MALIRPHLCFLFMISSSLSQKSLCCHVNFESTGPYLVFDLTYIYCCYDMQVLFYQSVNKDNS